MGCRDYSARNVCRLKSGVEVGELTQKSADYVSVQPAAQADWPDDAAYRCAALPAPSC